MGGIIMERKKYRPFRDNKECEEEMLKHPEIGFLRLPNNYLIAFGASSNGIYSDKFHTYSEALYRYKFADGTPFGIKEE